MTMNTIANNDNETYSHTEYGEVSVFKVDSGMVYFGLPSGVTVRCDSVGNFARDCRQI